jgi:Glycosyl hydrolase family 12
MGLRRVIVASFVVGALACGGSPARAATTTCDRFGTIAVAGGTYVFQNDEWNSTQTQCTAVDATTGAWTITQASFDLPTNGAPAAYPSIYRGCHWGNCTTQNPLPIQVSKLVSARSSWSTTQADAGAYDVAYDIWTNSSPTTSVQPDGSEIMIWLNSRGGVQPAGSLVATASIAGATWNVWTDRMSGWNYIAYQRTSGTTAVSDLDLRAFILDSVTRGSTSGSSYLIAVEAGFEIWKGGKGLASDSFSVSTTATTKKRPRARRAALITRAARTQDHRAVVPLLLPFCVLY